MVTNEANDLRAHALYDCCHFDALLEFGMSHSGRELHTWSMACLSAQALTGKVRT